MASKWKSKEGPKGKSDPEQWDTMVNDMNAWGKELESWGKRVRRDIIALEAQRDFLIENPGLSKEEYEKEFAKRAQAAHEKVGLPGRYGGGDPEDPPPPPWKERGEEEG